MQGWAVVARRADGCGRGGAFWEYQEADDVGRVLACVVSGLVEREEKPGLVQLPVASFSFYSCPLRLFLLHLLGLTPSES